VPIARQERLSARFLSFLSYSSATGEGPKTRSPLRMKVIQTDRQRAKSASRGVMDCVGDSRSDAGQRDFSEALGADWIECEIRFIDKLDRLIADVGVHGDAILRDIGVKESTKPRVDFARLSQTRADSPDQTSQDLASRGSRAEDLAAVDNTDGARDAHLVRTRIDRHLDEVSDELKADEVRIFRLGPGGSRPV